MLVDAELLSEQTLQCIMPPFEVTLLWPTAVMHVTHGYLLNSVDLVIYLMVPSGHFALVTWGVAAM